MMKAKAVGTLAAVALGTTLAFGSPAGRDSVPAKPNVATISDQDAAARADALEKLKAIGIGIAASGAAALALSRWKPRGE